MMQILPCLLLSVVSGYTTGPQPFAPSQAPSSVVASAATQPPTVSVKSLRGQANALSAAYVSKRFDAVYASFPPTYQRAARQQSGRTQEQDRQSYIKGHQDGSVNVTFASMAMRVTESAIRRGKNGTTYALLPTQRRVPLPEGKSVDFAGSTIALQENGRWYFLVLDSAQQLKLLQRTYPDLRGLKWPGLKIKRNG